MQTSVNVAMKKITIHSRKCPVFIFAFLNKYNVQFCREVQRRWHHCLIALSMTRSISRVHELPFRRGDYVILCIDAVTFLIKLQVDRYITSHACRHGIL